MGLPNLISGIAGVATNSLSRVGSLTQSLTGGVSSLLPVPTREVSAWGKTGLPTVSLEAFRLPGIPGLPSLPKLPGLPSMPKLPDLPGLPGLPNLPGLPGGSLPKLPGLPDLPHLPGLPNLPGIKLPDLPKLPGLPGFPGIPGGSLPGIPSMPGFPGIPGLPSIPSLPQMPSMPGLPSLPQLPGLPPLPSIPNGPDGFMPNLPGMPKLPNLPGLPSMPNLPPLPGLPKLPSLPQLPGLPGLPDMGFPDFPKLPSFPGLPSLPDLPNLPNIPGLPFFQNDNRTLSKFKGPEPVALAQMADDVYNSQASPPAGWRTADAQELASIGLKPADLAPPGSPFFARVYTTGTGADKQFVVAFRGSTSDIRDWKANGMQAAGLPTPHYTAALSIGRKLAQAGVTNVTMAGHSLGGGLASAAALASGTNANTFNAAGLSNATIAQANAIRENAGAGGPGDIRAYYVRGEILSLLQDGGDRAIGSLLGSIVGGPLGGIVGLGADAPEAYGTRIELDAVRPQGTPWWQGHPISRHGMDWVIASLQK